MDNLKKMLRGINSLKMHLIGHVTITLIVTPHLLSCKIKDSLNPNLTNSTAVITVILEYFGFYKSVPKLKIKAAVFLFFTLYKDNRNTVKV